MGAKMEPKCIPKWVPSPLRESNCRLSAKPIIYCVLATFWWCPKPPKIGFCRPNSRSSCSAHLLATRESSKSVWGAIFKPKIQKNVENGAHKGTHVRTIFGHPASFCCPRRPWEPKWFPRLPPRAPRTTPSLDFLRFASIFA